MIRYSRRFCLTAIRIGGFPFNLSDPQARRWDIVGGLTTNKAVSVVRADCLVALRVWIILILVAVCFLPGRLIAASVAEIAQYKAPNRQEFLETGARREGALMLYATGTQIQPLIEAFTKLHPYIKVSMPRASSEDVARKVIEEYQAGLYLVDAFELSSFGLAPLREQGILQSFVSPHQVNYPSSAFGPEGAWTSVRESYIGVGYNTNKIPKEAAPRTYADLLDEKWKNRMAVSGSDSSLSNMVGAMKLASATRPMVVLVPSA